MSPREAPRGTQAVQRAIRLLKSFSNESEVLTLSDLARRHGLARPTAHRILAALEAEGLLARCEGRAGYRLGPQASAVVEAGTSRRSKAASPPRQTPFFDRHREHHDSLEWRGWSGYVVPTSYQPTHTREYFALRNAAGLIDVSPLFKYEVRGRDALRLVNRIMTRDFRKCRVGQVMYGCWCDDHGDLIQDGNVVRLADDRFRITATDPSLSWFADCGYGMDVVVEDVSEQLAALAVQGPRSRAVLEEVAAGIDLSKLRYFRAAEATVDGRPLLVSRTGFTGDLGYELWIDADAAPQLWDCLLAAGAAHGVMPVGLMAMDAARIEAGLILIEVDFISSHKAFLESRKSTPFEVGLGWTVKLVDGNDFVGRAELERRGKEGWRWTVVGLEIPWVELEHIYGERGLRPQTVGCPPCREPVPVYAGGRQVGQVTSQVFSPLCKTQIALATLELGCASVGAQVEVEVLADFARTRARARVVGLPFYDPPHKRAVDPRPSSPSRGESGATRLG